MRRNDKLAFALVGGICSGKTAFTREMTKYERFSVISKDQCIYESDMLCRVGIKKSWEEIREEKIDALDNENVILDETIRVGKLDRIKAKGYTIVAVIMESDKTIRSQRLLERNEINHRNLCRLSEITGINLIKCTQNERRNLWRSKEFRDALPSEKQQEFDEILEVLYLLGSKVLKDEEPNPSYILRMIYIAPKLHQDLLLLSNPNLQPL